MRQILPLPMESMRSVKKLTCAHVAKKITNLSKFQVIELSAIEGLSQ